MKDEITSYIKESSLEKENLTVGLMGIGKTNLAILEILLRSDAVSEIRLRQQNGTSLHRFLTDRRVTILDAEHEKSNISEDILFVSPSVRREDLNIGESTVVISDTDLFFKKKRKNCFLISGSDGKSTTTTLIGELLKERFPTLFVGGNLGVPLADCDVKATDAFVIEMSSFSLRYSTPHSRRAVITSITPNHLDWHADYEEYVEAKKNVIKRSDEPIVNVDTADCEVIAKGLPLFAVCSSTHTFADLKDGFKAEQFVTVEDGLYLNGEKILDADNIRMQEGHNLSNLVSAVAMTRDFVTRDMLCEVARNFRGLEHRCERFLNADGISFIDSSIDTTPKTCFFASAT